ncbi:MAG: acetyl-CoA carboxylase carboxyltransferase subunit alpha [Candidatus Marinimicrobia bacterium]|nr:acetyl-CoA carboxylase carboxyltransferase subunit alpha [Candidatus Neomarinimicrobiota bacterium]
MKENDLIKKLLIINEKAKKRGINITKEIFNLEKKIGIAGSVKRYNRKKTKDAWDHVKLARKLERPKPQHFIDALITNRIELHGDRYFKDDKTIYGGVGYFDDIPVTFIGTRKGKDLKENQLYNFGMPNPEGYRKSLRLVKQAEKFKRPVLFFVDTPGAYPGIASEEHGISEAIARNLFEFSAIKTPMISIITGEGGSGGAIALSVAEKIIMMENSFLSVISPEGCASILFKDASKAPLSAKSLRLTAEELKKQNVIDDLILEEVGLHIDRKDGFDKLEISIRKNLKEIMSLTSDELIERRYKKYRQIGV